MASKSGEPRMTLLGVVLLLGLLQLSQHAAPVGADESAAPTKKNTSFSFHNTAGGRTLSSFSVNGAYSKKPVGKGN
ncbi:uncharacterized protein [Zea mays]|jgi:hypothetical protein|uniref:Uncharacterized protein n=1 Tax=Zea mays TaxID=4577 RepID=A0A1D6N362_MAIZE|nr:uncharacterized protein LOC103650850 [Zea mays]ONM35134.1 hypothetical protein ZEAMMB73_Zm00001d042354 [Zea mays]|eukprot:XP_008674665.1 uncharacterized protein LOC103650850 [Zea mays]